MSHHGDIIFERVIFHSEIFKKSKISLKYEVGTFYSILIHQFNFSLSNYPNTWENNFLLADWLILNLLSELILLE